MRCRGVVSARSEATWRSMGTQGVRRSLDCFAIARPEGRASFDALWLATTAPVPTNRIMLQQCSCAKSVSSLGARRLPGGALRGQNHLAHQTQFGKVDRGRFDDHHQRARRRIELARDVALKLRELNEVGE